jgi:hypothetical protein
MSLNESIVEDTSLKWFGELGYAVGDGAHLAPGEPTAERDWFGAVVMLRHDGKLMRGMFASRFSRIGKLDG